MSSLSHPAPAGSVADRSASDAAAPRPVLIYNCSRLGRVANPPGFSFTAWFKAGRRR